MPRQRRSTPLHLALVLAAATTSGAPSVVPTPPAPAPTPEPTPPPPATLTGLVRLRGADASLSPGEGSVVWVRGLGGAGPGRSTMESRGKRFNPRVTAVRAGTSIAFPNADRIYHNVFSRSAGNEFDLGLYRRGASRQIQLRNAGLVRVYCNIHPDMAGYVLVLERDAAFALAGADGSFTLGGLPAGRRAVRVWNEKAGEQELVVQLEAGRRTTLNPVLDASAYRLMPHKNKYGQDYPPPTEDDDRY